MSVCALSDSDCVSACVSGCSSDHLQFACERTFLCICEIGQQVVRVRVCGCESSFASVRVRVCKYESACLRMFACTGSPS